MHTSVRSTVKEQSMRKVAVVMVVAAGFFLDLPAKVEEVFDGAGKLQRVVGVLTVDFKCFMEKTTQERVVEIRDGDNESATTTAIGAVIAVMAFPLQTNLNS